LSRTFKGTCSEDDLADGVEIQTDQDFDNLGEGDTLQITTESGRTYNLFGPEHGDLTPGITVQPHIWALLMPKLERVGQCRFAVRLTPAQEGIIKGR
jgi:hypothetical protein